ncbi:hypothetical protein PPTG_20477, partial [Phytophthora nicotianae INRA-310]
VKSWAQRKLAVEEVEEELELEKDAFLLRLVLALLALVLQPLRPVELEPSRWRDSTLDVQLVARVIFGSSWRGLSRRRCLRHDSSSALPPNSNHRKRLQAHSQGLRGIRWPCAQYQALHRQKQETIGWMRACMKQWSWMTNVSHVGLRR